MPGNPLRIAGSSSHRAAGEHAAELFREHGRMVYGLCRLLLRDPVEADDATQATFVSAFKALLGGGAVREPAAWLATIARNECRARSQARMREPLPLLDADVGHGREPHEEVNRRFAVEEIREAIAGLPEKQREAVVLRDLYGLRYDEVGAALGLSRASVEALLFRGRRRLRVSLKPLAGGALAVPIAVREGIAQALPGFGAAVMGTGALASGAGIAAGGGMIAKITAAPMAAKLAAAAVAVGAAGSAGVVGLEHAGPPGPLTRPAAEGPALAVALSAADAGIQADARPGEPGEASGHATPESPGGVEASAADEPEHEAGDDDGRRGGSAGDAAHEQRGAAAKRTSEQEHEHGREQEREQEQERERAHEDGQDKERVSASRKPDAKHVSRDEDSGRQSLAERHDGSSGELSDTVGAREPELDEPSEDGPEQPHEDAEQQAPDGGE